MPYAQGADIRAASRPSTERPPPNGAQELEGYLTLADARLYYCDWLPEVPRAEGSALLVLMHGYGEHCRRYDELAEYLLRRGHGVLRFDARGHGRSAGQRGHVRNFSEYVSDLRAVVARAGARYPGRALFVLGHSNGGLVALRAVQQGLAGLAGLVLTSPALELRASRKPVPESVARALSWALPRLPLPNGIRARDLTHDLAIREAHALDPWVHPRATPRWYWSMTVAGRQALASAERVQLPLLVVTAEQDPIVEPARAKEFFARAASRDKRLLIRSGAFHEVLSELDRRELFGLLGDWIERVLGERAAASG